MTAIALTPYLKKLAQGQALTPEESDIAVPLLFAAEADPVQVAAFLVLLRAKPETATEILSFIQYMQAHMVKIPQLHQAVDIVGTGGDGQNTINISTGAAILAAACGVKIVKHGNRAVSSLSGAADVLEALGIKINLSAQEVAACVEQIGIGFCFAPLFHPVFQQLKTLRARLGVPTTLNLLGPLLNPAAVDYRIIGVANPIYLDLFAEILQALQVKQAFIVHGGGLDEITTLGTAEIIAVSAQGNKRFSLDPTAYGFQLGQLADLRGGTAAENAQCLTAALSGTVANTLTDTLILNAACAVWLYGVASSLTEAIGLVKQKLQAGAARQLLQKWQHWVG